MMLIRPPSLKPTIKRDNSMTNIQINKSTMSAMASHPTTANHGTQHHRCTVQMLPAKCSYFFYYSMAGCFLPFCNVFMQDVGLTVPECGFITGMSLVAVGICTPVWGMVVDMTGRPKLIYSVLSVLTVCFMTPLPFVAGYINPKQLHVNSTITIDNSAIFHTTGTTLTRAVYLHTQFSGPLFFSMLILNTCASICQSPLLPMIEGAVMQVIETKLPDATYGNQRLFGSVGFGLSAFVTGLVVEYLGSGFERYGLSRYTCALCLFLPFASLTLPFAVYLLSQMKMPLVTNDDGIIERNINKLKMVASTFSNVKNITFLITIFVSGFSSMIEMTFLFVLMEETMSAPKYLMGLAVLVQCLAVVVTFPFADVIIRKLGGPARGMAVGVFSYTVRYVANSFIVNPWFVLVTQTLHCFGFAIYWTSQLKYTKTIAAEEIYVTMFSIVEAMHLGAGGIVANLVGGLVWGVCGGKVLFQGTGVMCALWTIVVIVFL